jgi:hypothetical protein
LLADEDDLGVNGTFAEHSLCGALIQVAPGTAFGCLS